MMSHITTQRLMEAHTIDKPYRRLRDEMDVLNRMRSNATDRLLSGKRPRVVRRINGYEIVAVAMKRPGEGKGAGICTLFYCDARRMSVESLFVFLKNHRPVKP